MIQEQKKYSNNNNSTHSHNNLNIVTTFEDEQKTLFGDVKVKTKFKLNDNYFQLIGMMSLNPDFKFNRNKMYALIKTKMHLNTITNFIKYSESNNFIKKCVIIPGATINNLFIFQKLPDKFDDGSICKDVRATYYSVTKLGQEVFKLNEKMRML